MRNLFFIIASLCSLATMAQSGYKIDFKIKGMKDSTVYLCSYVGETPIYKDTAKMNNQGAFSFNGKNPIARGTYFFAINSKEGKSKPKEKLPFDFVVGKDQNFSIETDKENYTLKVSGDEDNQAFAENIAFLSSLQKDALPLLKIIRDTTLNDAQKKDAREKFKMMNDKVVAFQNDLITKHPGTVTANLLKSSQEIIIPDPPKKTDGSIDSSFQFRYYRDHYFDNFDLADEANVHMPRPTYQDKVYDYLDRLFIQQPDSVTKAIDKLVAKAQKNQETYKYMVWICVKHYQAPKIMGLDEVYVNIVDKYFKTGAMDFWIDPQSKKGMIDYADKVRRAMIGRIGPNLMMQDQNGQPKSMYDIKKKYTILYIFDPDCGHCREESPKLVNFYNKNKDKLGIEVFAVSADTSMQKMRDYIKEMKMPWITVNGPRTYIKQHYSELYFSDSTPSLYILDEKKKVIARKLSVEDLPNFFDKHEKFVKKQPTASKGAF